MSYRITTNWNTIAKQNKKKNLHGNGTKIINKCYAYKIYNNYKNKNYTHKYIY